MLLKIKNFFLTRDYYKIAAAIICVNALFELAFQYCFQTEIEVVYFFVSLVISVVFLKNMRRWDKKKFLPIFYYFWPVIIICISSFSTCKFSLLPFVISSIGIIFAGRFRKKPVKIIVALVNIIMLLLYLSLWWLLVYWPPSITEIKSRISSPGNKYLMILEETDVFPGGGNVSVYVGRRIDFGIFGNYQPRTVKYTGPCGEYPEIHFVDDEKISIDGEVVEIKGRNYIDKK